MNKVTDAIDAKKGRTKLRQRIPYTWPSYNENFLKSIFDSVSYYVVILRTTPHWSVKMSSCNFRLGGFFKFTTDHKTRNTHGGRS